LKTGTFLLQRDDKLEGSRPGRGLSYRCKVCQYPKADKLSPRPSFFQVLKKLNLNGYFLPLRAHVEKCLLFNPNNQVSNEANDEIIKRKKPATTVWRHVADLLINLDV
jgi:hypothetical protein